MSSDRVDTAHVAVHAGPSDFLLAPERTAVLVIDMQKDFLVDGGYVDSLGYDVAPLRGAIAPIRRLLDRVRGTEILVVHTRYGKRPDLLDEPPAELERFRRARDQGITNVPMFGEPSPLGRVCIKGEEGWELLEELAPLEGEPIIEKSTMSCFRFTDLELILRSQGRDSLLLTGITTDVCVGTTLRDGSDLGLACCLLTDCCAAATIELHQAQVDHLVSRSGRFGWWSGSESVIAALDEGDVRQSADRPPAKSTSAPW